MNHLPKADNPYAIVREKKWCEDCNGIHIVHTKSYDAKNRVVGISTVMFRGKKNIGNCAHYVESDSYWHGGAYNSEIGMGCQICQPLPLSGTCWMGKDETISLVAPVFASSTLTTASVSL